MVDVLIQTHNEQLNLPHTLETIRGWVNKVFVVDSGSTDGTQKVAEAFNATFVHHDWEGYAAQKNWALDNLPFESPWVLILDADEACSPELVEEIKAIVSRLPDDVPEAAFHLNRVFIFMGRRIKHCGYFPSWNLRLFKRGRAKYEQRLVHEHMIVDGPTGYLQHLLLHEDRRGLEHFIAKHNRYSTLEAHEIYSSREAWPGVHSFLFDRMQRRRYIKNRVLPFLPLPWVLRFIYMYILKLGFLDGRAGWYLCLFISSYEFFIRMKYTELIDFKGRHHIGIGGLAVDEGGLGAVESAPQSVAAVIAPPTPTPVALLPVARTTPTTESEVELSQAVDAPEVKNEPLILPPAINPAVPRSAVFSPNRHTSPWTFREKVTRLLWGAVESTFFRYSLRNAYGFRAFLLRMFGAKLAADVRIRPSVHVEIPWNLTIGTQTVIGDHAILYCLGPVTVGRYVTISQYAHICAGTHELDSREFTLIKPPITLGDDVWIASDAFVGPGVTIGEGTIVGARSSVFKDLPPWVIAVGNPAKPVKPRPFRSPPLPPPKQGS